MAPIKRKKVDEESQQSPKSTLHIDPDRASKRHRGDAKLGGAAATALPAEKKSYQRGGASLLTPLEVRQIHRQAELDVLFEDSQDQTTTKTSVDDVAPPTAKKTPKKKRKAQGEQSTKHGQPSASEEVKIKVEGLSYKKLVAGTIVLGQIFQITPRDLVLSLPNGLTGFVPLTRISSQFLKRVERYADKDDDESQQDDNDNLDLRSIFYEGQYLRAYVISAGEDDAPGAKSKKRIELSVNPQDVNKGMSKLDLVENAMIQASVISNEEHGLVMDLGMEDSTLRGFMSAKELGEMVGHDDAQEGAVHLCLITKSSSDGRIVKLSINAARTKNLKKHCLHEAPSVNVFLPGAPVEVLITDVPHNGVVGKIMGILDATADFIHAGTLHANSKEHAVGNKVKGRVAFTFPDSEPRKVGVSFLPHILALGTPGSTVSSVAVSPLQQLPLSSFIEAAEVKDVIPGLGLIVDVGIDGVYGFVHINRISDTKVDSLSSDSGAYATGTSHRGRVVGYNSVDCLLQVSLQESILNQPFLRIDDIQPGHVVKGTVEQFHFTGQGTAGLRIRLAEGITGFVPELHLADVHLQHPDRKYREGMSVTARVLSVDADRRRVSLTLKKSLIHSEAEIWHEYQDIAVGTHAPGTITKLLPSGAEVHFFGKVKGWLHRSEMSEAYIADPTTHFRLGQTVNVRVLSVDPEKRSLKLSCRDPDAISPESRNAFKNLVAGDIVGGTILEKTPDAVTVELDSGVKATLRLNHLTDSSEKKQLAELKRLRVGQTLHDLVVLKKIDDKVAVILSHKPSILKAAKDGTLLKTFEDVKEGGVVSGFVRHINPDQVFIEFANGLCGALFKSQMREDMLKLPDFGLTVNEAVTASVCHVDYSQRRFRLSMKQQPDTPKELKATVSSVGGAAVVNPVDGKTQNVEDFAFGSHTKVSITSVKDTQLNVQLADKILGRIDVSEAFSDWDSIQDKKHPLRQYKAKEVLDVCVIGMHDSRNHRFLPLSHRQGKVPVFELTTKLTQKLIAPDNLLTLDKLAVGTVWTAFVNNHGSNCVWVNLSPSVRGRISHMDLTDDISMLADISAHFPVGCALSVNVKSVNSSAGHLDLVAADKPAPLVPVTWDSLSVNDVLPGRVITSAESYIYVSLSPEVAGSVGLTEITDDYDDVETARPSSNDFIRVKVISVDVPNKRVALSARPSNVLDSSIKPHDPQVLSFSSLSVNDVRRGFVKNIFDKGIFVTLGPNITAFVRISDLSDTFIKDWKAAFTLNQLVTGKIVAVDSAINHVQMTLKESMLTKDYVPPLSLNDLTVGQVVTGKVRKVEHYGVFIQVDNSKVSGLCHKSKMAEGRVEDVKSLYNEGDIVKAIVLEIVREKRRVNFGLKASYFRTGSADDSDEDLSDEGGVALDSDAESDDDGLNGVELADNRSVQSTEGSNDEADTGDRMDMDQGENGDIKMPGLLTRGFDWTGTAMDLDEQRDGSASESEEDLSKKKRRRKAQIQVDRTGDLDAHGPRSVADFERLLLGQPHSSLLWISYMAFQLQLNEVDKARAIAKRALKTIDQREEDEKLQVRVALLNLENSFGSEESLEEAFKEACQYHDERAIHDKTVGIYVQSGKLEKADSLYATMLGNQAFRADPGLWISYAALLHATINDPPRARALLNRATMSVPQSRHRYLTSKFGALEFKSPNGDCERGRTIFEGLLSAYPRQWDIWDMYVELEDKHAEEEKARKLYERMSKTKMKKGRAKKMFSSWVKWEARKGNQDGVIKAKAMEQEWFEKHAEQEKAEDDE